MDSIGTRTIKKRELDGTVSEEARRLFAKLKDRPEIEAGISFAGTTDEDDAPQSP